MHSLRFNSVTKRFGDFVALDSVDLTVAPGEKVAIMGPSGSGKTTLLRIAMTLEEPSSGSVSIGNLTFDGSITERGNRRMLRDVRDRVGMVFQGRQVTTDCGGLSYCQSSGKSTKYPAIHLPSGRIS